ncbi:DNA repair protein RecO [Flaviaesturariibacter aridisoli]|uniref:DNA repair protein RecO n=1 Tax=Flaviaesturariibacter aridisoli TaxID=2545761 RepID=A0A4R4DYX8_9BACT|nr:DNA repair protein RecO [Flaviaesturariibacter aridisoli]TCZ70999.1 DNA repair protein RecO [Flaviaesturariibacter aridisoli]
MLHKTKGIVLRTVKYGESSLIVTAFTELFGLQSYIVNSVRKASAKGGSKAAYFQPASQLDLVVYHQPGRNLNRIREFKWSFLYQHVLSDIFKNAVAQFLIELLHKSLKEPEANNELYYFTEDALQRLDEASPSVTANFPLFFALHLPVFFGFRIPDEWSPEQPYLDLKEGLFTEQHPQHPYYLDGRAAEVVAHILKVLQPDDLADVRLTGELRREILQHLEQYYALHLPEFGTLRTLPVLKEITA